MLLIQFRKKVGSRRVGMLDEEGWIRVLADTESARDLAFDALLANKTMDEVARERVSGEKEDYGTVASEGRLLPPLDHLDPAHCFITGTGLTHLGSADARDKMHVDAPGEEELTDSIRMFRMGVEGGKPPEGEVGVQPEWFYKGDGSCLVPPGGVMPMPPFALHHGEETEVVGLYVIADDGTPCRLGFALGNESSDHVMEKQNYLYLAHSKLRVCSVGPALRTGELPGDVRGVTRVIRAGKAIWEKEFLSGEENMSHLIRNLEHHHFKYRMFRRPGDVHVHFFGAATLSYAEGVLAEPGDVFEIESPPFGPALRNRVERVAEETPAVRAL